MKVLKILGWVLLALILFIGLSIYLTASNLNAIVKQVVEQVGSEVLQTNVTLREADIQLLEGSARLSGLTIANVPGYQSPTLFSMETIQVTLNIEALANKVVELSTVRIDGIDVVAEQKGTSTNIQALMNNLPAGDGAGSTGEESGDSGSGDSEFRFKIDDFQFADSQARVITDRWGETMLKMPAVSLQQIGGKDGVPPDQLATEILRPLMKQLNRSLEKGIKTIAEEKAREKLGEKEDELKARYRDKLNEEFGDDADNVDATLKSLLKK